MMQLYRALILLMILSTACGLRCYSCVTPNPKACTRISLCPGPLDRCFSTIVNGLITKGCRRNQYCIKPISCCGDDLCNSAIPTSGSVILLLVSSAITTLFL
ncbi:lymphocyte antigen 6G-like [Lates japonicus]